MSRVDQALKRAGRRDAAGPASPQAPRAVESYPSETDDAAWSVTVPEYAPDAPPAESLRAAPERRPRRSSAPVAEPATAPGRFGLAESLEGKIVVGEGVSPLMLEEYRRLAAAVHLMQSQSGIHSLMISSALPRDGKTLTSTNLALTLSESYSKRVLLIDADLRRPSIREAFALPEGPGLADVLRTDSRITLPIAEVTPRLSILIAGNPDSSPSAALVSNRMRALMAEAAQRFDWVLLDTPPVGLLSDANLLGSLVDGVILVVGAGSTPYPAVARAVAQFGRERILGVVLNRVDLRDRPENYYSRYYIRPETGSGGGA